VNLPPAIAAACAPLFDQAPMESAMTALTGSHPIHTELVEQVLNDPAMQGRAELAAGLWLYVDDLERSHATSQTLPDPTGAFWHGIMHRRDGDFSNSRYWMRRAASHPLIAGGPRLDPGRLVDAVERSRGDDTADLIARQRAEWQSLFEWCANSI